MDNVFTGTIKLYPYIRERIFSKSIMKKTLDVRKVKCVIHVSTGVYLGRDLIFPPENLSRSHDLLSRVHDIISIEMH